MRSKPGALAAAVAAQALAVLAVAGAAVAQQAPVQQAPAEPPTQPFLHGWRATLGYGNTAGGLDDNPGSRIGFGRSEQAMAGLEAGIGSRGFGRIEAGYGWRGSKRAYTADDLAGESDSRILGVSGGVFVTPFLAAGLAVQYRRHAGTDAFTNRAGGTVSSQEIDGSSWRTAPFLLLAAPAGPVTLSLLGAYARTRGHSDYESSLLPGTTTREKTRTSLRMAEFSVSHRPLPQLRLGAGLTWTQVLHQRTAGSELELDDDWGRLSLDAGWETGSGLELRAGISHEIENARGNSFGWTLGMAYRF